MGFWEKLWTSIVNFFTANVWNIVLFMAVLILGLIVIKIVLKMLQKIFHRTKLERTLSSFLIGIIKFLLLIVYIMTLLTLLGIPITSLVAIFTALSLAVALAVQSFLSSLAYGMILLAGKLYKEGDYVEIDSVGGTVEKVNMLNTVLKTPNGQIVSVPHNKTSSAVVTNYTSDGIRRLDITVSVAYDSDIDKVKSVLEEVMSAQPKILTDQPKAIVLKEFSSSSINLAFRAWTSIDNYWDTQFSVNEEILKAFRHHNIKIPFNQLDVNVKK